MKREIIFILLLSILIFIGGYLLSYLPTGPFDKWWAIPYCVSVILWIGMGVYLSAQKILFKEG